MNAPENDKKFTPKQALQPTPQLYDLLISDSMENLAISSISQAPSIPSGSFLHDNGCGTGAATKAIVQAVSASGVNVSIQGTDINDNALDTYKASAVKESWPAEAAHQDSLKLDIANNTFSHSILNALLFVLPSDGVGAISEAYRTLKPGGIMLTNSWHYVPNMEPIQTAAKLTRPEGTPLPRQGMQK